MRSSSWQSLYSADQSGQICACLKTAPTALSGRTLCSTSTSCPYPTVARHLRRRGVIVRYEKLDVARHASGRRHANLFEYTTGGRLHLVRRHGGLSRKVRTQFIKTRSTVVDEASIRSSALGLKDTGTSASVVWDRLFRIPVQRKGKNLGMLPSHCVELQLIDVVQRIRMESMSVGSSRTSPHAGSTTSWRRVSPGACMRESVLTIRYRLLRKLLANKVANRRLANDPEGS